MIHAQQCEPDFGDFFATTGDKSAVMLRWLGQAGFALAFGATRLLIDPYLSNSLAMKYQNSEFPHVRLMPPPIEPQDVPEIGFVVCTHRHSDHMDPGTLPVIAARYPQCRFFVPRAEIQAALSMGIPAERIIGINAGESFPLEDGLRLSAIPAAHEDLTRNSAGEYVALGYVFETPDVRIYHSGDCVPYPGLSDQLRGREIDIALLPVNGRNPSLTARGIPGNFTFDEAAALCRAARIPWLIPHHFGMFAFNSADPAELERKRSECGGQLRCLLPDTQRWIKAENVPGVSGMDRLSLLGNPAPLLL